MTEDRNDVEKYLRGIGAEYRWENDGSLVFGYKRPAMINFPLTGESQSQFITLSEWKIEQ